MLVQCPFCPTFVTRLVTGLHEQGRSHAGRECIELYILSRGRRGGALIDLRAAATIGTAATNAAHYSLEHEHAFVEHLSATEKQQLEDLRIYT